MRGLPKRWEVLQILLERTCSGLWSRYTDEEHVVHHGSSALAYAFVVPVFFVNIGLEANVTSLGAAPLFTIWYCWLLPEKSSDAA